MEPKQELTLFKYNQQDVRVVMKDDEPWFVAKDVCDILNLANTSMAIAGLDDDEKLTSTLLISGQNREVSIISESGLYSLVLRSNKPEAKIFKRHVVHEILPSIRKHGAYMTEITHERILANPDFGIKLLTDLKNERERVKQMEQQRNYAEMTKSWISDKKTATAMNTASQLSKKVNKLETELGLSKDYATIKCVESITDEKYDWKKLKSYSIAHSVDIIKVYDANYGSINAYHKSAWYDCYQISLKDLMD